MRAGFAGWSSENLWNFCILVGANFSHQIHVSCILQIEGLLPAGSSQIPMTLWQILSGGSLVWKQPIQKSEWHQFSISSPLAMPWGWWPIWGQEKKYVWNIKTMCIHICIYILIPQKANVRNVKLAVRDFLQRLLYTGGLGRTAGVFDGVVIKECLVGLLFPFVLWNCALTILSRNHPILFETCFQDSIFKKILKKNIWEIGYLSPQRICWFVGLSHCNFQNTVHARLALFDRFRDDLWRNLVSSAVLVPSIF